MATMEEARGGEAGGYPLIQSSRFGRASHKRASAILAAHAARVGVHSIYIVNSCLPDTESTGKPVYCVYNFWCVPQVPSAAGPWRSSRGNLSAACPWSTSKGNRDAERRWWSSNGRRSRRGSWMRKGDSPAWATTLRWTATLSGCPSWGDELRPHPRDEGVSFW